MRLELNENKTVQSDSIREMRTGVSDEIKEQKAKFKNLDFKGKCRYIWDYYKWFFIIGIVVIVAAHSFITAYIDNSKPTYLYAELLNTNFAIDNTNTLEADYINQFNVDLDVYNLYIDTSISLSEESFDTMMMATQQKIMSLYSAQELDVVIGPVDVMEGSANCNCYADLSKVLPQDLIDELIDREYEFYYYDPVKIALATAKEDAAIDGVTFDGKLSEEEKLSPVTGSSEPYFAGVYLDTCSYLNNNGEYGAYNLSDDESKRPIFTIPNNTKNMEHAIEFLRFLIENK